MLSRVAAVKAPRTHNRRRVTGSSGRRREGSESEPQRPNMSRRVFASAVLLLFVVMMCCGSGAATADEAASGERSPPKTYFDWRDVKKEETVGSLRVPSLVEVNGDVFAVAEAQCTKGDSVCDFNGIASELLESAGEQTEEELDKTTVKTQVLDKCPFDGGNCPSQERGPAVSQSETKVHVSRPTTVVKESAIYMLAGTYSRKATVDAEEGGADDWGLLLVKGNVSCGGSEKRIDWNDTYGLPWALFKKQHESLKRLIGGGRSGVRMKDGTLVFPVEGKKKGNVGTEEDVKTVSLIIYSRDIASWEVSKGMSAGGCSVPSVVEWEKDKLMMLTACDDGRRRVYESGDKGDSWMEALGTLSRVWGNKQEEQTKRVGSGFITAKIDNRDVMLVTLPVYPKNTEKGEKGVLHLWLTDNTHIVDIGPVSGNDDDAAASSLLYKSGETETNNNEELIALYEKRKDDGKTSRSLWAVRLTGQLEKVKDVLATWKKVDDRVSQLCLTSSAAESASPDNACTSVVTAGLVGFLSGNFSDGTWRDEYLGVNATVKSGVGAAGTTDGVKFTGRGAGAEWPVGKQGENQLYHFANYNFTLVATVSVDKVPEEGPISLIGVKTNGKGNPVLLGLSYDSGGKWKLLCGGGTSMEHSSTWEKKIPYRVAIVLQNGSQGSAYVDGQRVGDAPCELKVTDSNEISHFYIGGDGGSAGRQDDVSVTVSNVLLYNRPLDDNEMEALKPNEASILPLVNKHDQGNVIPSFSGGNADWKKMLRHQRNLLLHLWQGIKMRQLLQVNFLTLQWSKRPRSSLHKNVKHKKIQR
ncbi:c71 surface protein [Trypanosoma cruzi]|nr:c71 surface protein [Trypanosoma cruzi]